jgi:hypothetical protein
MNNPATAPKLCGARRPGWESGPAIGINRIPCVRNHGHEGNHANAWAQQWTADPAPTPAFLTVCGHPSAAAVPIRDIPSAGESGHTLYACPDCAPKYGPGPQWDELPAMRR